MKHRTSWTVDASPERVAELFCTETFHLEDERSRPDVVSATARVVDDTETRRIFEVRCDQYKRTKLGRVDKSGTEPARTRYTYDRANHSLAWTWDGSQSDRITISGIYRLRPDGERTLIEHEIDVHVRIPLIGERVAKVVVKEVESAVPRTRRLLDQRLREASNP